MNRLIAIIFLLPLLAPAVQAAEIYKTKDKYGNPVFSDQGAEAAEPVELSEPTVFDADKYTDPLNERRQNLLRRRTVRGTADQTEESPEFQKYTRLEVISPYEGEAVRANDGNIEISIQIAPKINQDHTIELLVDGTQHARINSNQTIKLNNMDRGTHSFQLQVLDREGEILQSGAVTTITVLRVSRPRS